MPGGRYSMRGGLIPAPATAEQADESAEHFPYQKRCQTWLFIAPQAERELVLPVEAGAWLCGGVKKFDADVHDRN